MNAGESDRLGATQLSAMKQSFHQGSLRASEALAGWIDKPSVIEVDSVERLPLEEATGVLSRGDDPVCFCSMEFGGLIAGEIILVFDDASGWALGDLLLDQEIGTASTWDEMTLSAVLETTNILCCAYLNSLSDLLADQGESVSLVPAPPRFNRDFAESLMEFALMGQAISFDSVILARTKFEISGTRVQCTLLFIPDAESMLRLGRWLATTDDSQER